MKRRRDSQLDAFRPHRIVVVLAVESEHVEPRRVARRVGRLRHYRRYLAPHHARHHHDFQPEFLHHVLEFGARLLRRMHRDHRRGRHAIGKLAEKFRDEPVERAAGCAPRFVVRMKRNAESRGRIQHGEIHAEFVEAFVEQPRQNLGRAIARVLRRHRPECLLRAAPAFASSSSEPSAASTTRPLNERNPSTARLPPNFSNCSTNDRTELQPMPVGVDHRMLETPRESAAPPTCSRWHRFRLQLFSKLSIGARAAAKRSCRTAAPSRIAARRQSRIHPFPTRANVRFHPARFRGRAN